jgi:hypothetical protein
MLDHVLQLVGLKLVAYSYALPLKTFGACGDASNFLGFPKWYRGLPGCASNDPRISNINQVWKIIANVTEMVLRVGVLLAVAMIIWGGVMFIVSRGEPDRIKNARSVVTNAVIGLVLAIFATAIVSFIAGRF